MRVNEIIQSMEEGVNDPHIFKAVFLWQAVQVAGKSHMWLDKMLGRHGPQN